MAMRFGRLPGRLKRSIGRSGNGQEDFRCLRNSYRVKETREDGCSSQKDYLTISNLLLSAPRNAIGDDFGVHLEVHDHATRFWAVIAVDGDAISEHLERVLKTTDCVNVSAPAGAIEIADVDAELLSRRKQARPLGLGADSIRPGKWPLRYSPSTMLTNFSMKIGSSDGS